MKLPNFRRIFKTDYGANEQGLVEKLATSINNGFEVLYEALNGKVSLRENIFCTVKDVTVIVDSSGVPTTTTTVSRDRNARVDGVGVINAQNLTNSTSYPTSGIFISFNASDNGITITNITGLQAGNEYSLRVILWLV